MRKLKQLTEAAGCGLFLAVLGFSYAVATTKTLAPPPVRARALQRPGLSFITPADLGDVLVGSFFVRQIVVDGGMPPHTFRFGVNAPTENISINEYGLLSGVISADGDYDFDVQVSDKVGVNQTDLITQSFSITAQTQTVETETMSFLDEAVLPSALTGSPYAHSFAVTGGMPPYRFQLDSPADAAALPTGLFFVHGDNVMGVDPDGGGLLYGKPAEATSAGSPAKFNVRVTDSRGVVQIKEFSLTVYPGIVTGDVVAVRGGFKLDFGGEEKDSLNLVLAVDKGELRYFSDIEGQDFALIIGGKTLPPTITVDGTEQEMVFNARGEIKFPDMTAGLIGSRDLPEFMIRFDPRKGLLRMTFKRFSLASALGATREGFRDPVLPVILRIGNIWQRTGTLRFSYRRRNGGRIGIGTLARKGASGPSGHFLVTKVRGRETSDTTETDTLVLRIQGYLRQPGGGAVVPLAGDTVGVFMGLGDAFEIPESSLTIGGRKLKFASFNADDMIKRFELDTARGRFLIETYPLSPTDLGFERTVLTAGDSFSLPVGLWFVNTSTNNTTFHGETTVTLYRRGNRLTNK